MSAKPNITISTNAGTEVMYLLYRSILTGTHPNMFNHSAGSSKDFITTYFHKARKFKANDGILVRLLNGDSDASVTFDMTVLYKD